ncbi:MAG: FAD-binding oxidoreductase [Marinibacterium sp.]|nr:FAD-binding oxidoreductase [Marinibacterium sp.]
MPGPDLIPFRSDPALPRRCDVVVIGGGIIGVCTALELAERGRSVLLCEKGDIGGEQSSRNWGWVRMSLRDPREIPLMAEALRLWDGLDARIGGRTGFTRSGILYEASSDRTIDTYSRWIRNLDGTGQPARMIDGAELAALLPGRRGAARAALYTPQDGRAEPQWAAPAIAEGARAAGAAVVTRCAVRSLDRRGGAVRGVVTERGRVDADAVVLAGGAWSRLFAGNAGIALPQLKVLNSVMRTGPLRDRAAGGPEATLGSDRYALRRRADGGYTVASSHMSTHHLVPDSFALTRAFWPALRQDWRSTRIRLNRRWWIEAGHARRWSASDITPFETCRVLDPAPEHGLLDQVWDAARAGFPALNQTAVVQRWGGMIDVTPDAVPVISGTGTLPGLVIATGFSGHGFGIAPGAGRLVADLVTGDAPCVDPTPFRLARFFDGSPVGLDSGG